MVWLVGLGDCLVGKVSRLLVSWGQQIVWLGGLEDSLERSTIWIVSL